MTVAKEIKSEGTPVMVETDATGQLPNAVREASSGLGAIPHVIFADPSGTIIYGAFDHSKLKSQDYRSIFRDAKKKVREAKDDGSLLATAPGGPPAASPDQTETPSTETIAKAEFETWTSSKGSKIKARLVAFELDRLYVFELEDGKSLKVTREQLSLESADRADELLRSN